VVRDNDAVELVHRLGCDALLSFKTSGIEDPEVRWTTPRALAVAAFAVSAMVRRNAPETAYLVELYEMSWGLDGDIDAASALSIDLADIGRMAERAGSLGATRMTLDVNW
jgi:hypothetical protein